MPHDQNQIPTRTAVAPTDHRDPICVRDPDTGETLATLAPADSRAVDRAVARAVEAAPRLAGLPTRRRIEALRAAAAAIENQAETFVEILVGEGIKTITEVRVEVSRAAQTLRGYADAAGRNPDPSVLIDRYDSGSDRTAGVHRIPAGVAAAITPFNDPLNLVAHKIGAATAAGCPVVVKPHEATPLSGRRLALLEAWAELDPAAVQSVIGGGEVGHALVSHPNVRVVSFTGGVRTGREVAAAAGVKKLIMELGGNCPVLVWEDADLDAAVPALTDGIVSAAGQNCLHVQRIYVADGLFQDLRERLAAALKTVRTGPKRDPQTQMGPLITPSTAERVDRQVRRAVSGGASVLVGGERIGRSGYAPTLLTDVSTEHAVSTDEMFAPVTMIAPVDTLDDALHRMNDDAFGLQAGVFTNSVSVWNEATKRLRYGTILLNDTSDHRTDAMPFGGLGDSGLGREGGAWGISEYTEVQTVVTRTST